MDRAFQPTSHRWHPAVWRSRLRLRWPLIVWLLAAVGAVVLYYNGGKFGGISGVVEGVEERVAPLVAGRLTAVYVTVGKRVKAGDIVAEMDPSVELADLTVDRLEMERRFAAAVGDFDREIRDLQRQQAADDGERAQLQEEIARLETLLEKHLVDVRDLVSLRTRRRALEAALALYPGQLRELEARRTDMAVRQQLAAVWMSGEPAAATNSAAGLPPSSLFEARRELCRLRARSDGVVLRVSQAPGTIVAAGEEIALLLTDAPLALTGFLPESNLTAVSPGMVAYARSAATGGDAVLARVVSLTPEIAPLPNRVNPFRSLASYRGRRVLFEFLESHAFMPGESVTIEFRRPLFDQVWDWFRHLRQPPQPGPYPPPEEDRRPAR